MQKLKFFINGEWRESKTDKYYDIYNPSTGEVIAQTPCCTKEEVEEAVQAAKEAFESWAAIPVMKRVQVLYKFRDLLDQAREVDKETGQIDCEDPEKAKFLKKLDKIEKRLKRDLADVQKIKKQAKDMK